MTVSKKKKSHKIKNKPMKMKIITEIGEKLMKGEVKANENESRFLGV